MALYNSTRDFAAASVHIGLRLMMILNFLIPGFTMQHVMLNSSIPNGSRVCSGQSIEIECATTGAVQAWGSNNYIGQTTGDLEEFTGNDEIGTVIHTGNLNTSIELLNSTQSEIEGVVNLQCHSYVELCL